MAKQLPILGNKDYDALSVFTAENLLREARRQKALDKDGEIPAICILDPDGDFAQYLLASGSGCYDTNWVCYHTKLVVFVHDDIQYGVIPYAVGASFAVLVAEELFASGCQLPISITSAGQIVEAGSPPNFVLIDGFAMISLCLHQF